MIVLLFVSVTFMMSAGDCHAQFSILSIEDRTTITREWKGERFPDGRPKIPDDILERMKEVTIEEAWGVLRGAGYNNQFEGNWYNIHPERVIVGRAVTASFLPYRPDLDSVTEEKGKAAGGVGGQNSWVIDTLKSGDLIVVDIFGKVEEGTFAGDNLANSIAAKSGTGMVVDGTVRDLDGIYDIPDFNAFVRGADPTAINNVTLNGINIPIRIGKATVMPGDVVLGRREGVIFIPPQLAERVVESSEHIRLVDDWGHKVLKEGKYSPGQVDGAWTDEMKQDFEAWKSQRLKGKN